MTNHNHGPIRGDQFIQEMLSLPLMEMHLRAESVFQLVALIQLALRHPQVPSGARATGVLFVNLARDYFQPCPLILDLVKQGDDPANDVRVTLDPEVRVRADEGADLRFAITADRSNGVVRLHFAQPVTSLGITVDQARAVADGLRAKAIEVERGIV